MGKINHNPDGNFPNGVPNPLVEENRPVTIQAIKDTNADWGVAWDGDFDRCFFFDEKGNFIEGYYIVGLLAENFLKKQPGSKIVHDPRLTWNTIDVANAFNGTAVESKTGHAFIKERMRFTVARWVPIITLRALPTATVAWSLGCWWLSWYM